MRFYWEQQSDDDPSGFLALTSLLRLHDLMTTSVDNCLRNEFRIGLTDFQILKALQLSETGTWLLSRMAWHLMVHATTVTLAARSYGFPGLSPIAGPVVDRDGRPRPCRAGRPGPVVRFGAQRPALIDHVTLR